jgi:hypothetical protein
MIYTNLRKKFNLIIIFSKDNFLLNFYTYLLLF